MFIYDTTIYYQIHVIFFQLFNIWYSHKQDKHEWHLSDIILFQLLICGNSKVLWSWNWHTFGSNSCEYVMGYFVKMTTDLSSGNNIRKYLQNLLFFKFQLQFQICIEKFLIYVQMMDHQYYLKYIQSSYLIVIYHHHKLKTFVI